MCNEAVSREPYTLWHVSDHLKAREMCNEAMCDKPAVFFLIPDRLKTQECCIKAVEVDPWQLDDAPDHFKRQEMCDEALRETLPLCSMFPIGLLQGRGYIGSMMNIMTMMVIIGSMMKIDFLRDTMAIKNGRPRKHFFMFLTVLRHKRCVLRQLRKIHLTWDFSMKSLACWNIFLIILKLKECVKTSFKKIYEGLIMSLIILRPKRCVKRPLKNIHTT